MAVSASDQAMACYHPLRAFRTPGGVVFSELSRHDITGTLWLPCGQCIGCRLRRASDWEIRVMHEAQSWDRNCFVTLTYEEGSLPPYGSLRYEDVQAFLKRLRQDECRYQKRLFGLPKLPKHVIRFFGCGEYGEQRERPHYHLCLFNMDFEDRYPWKKSSGGFVMDRSPRLEKLWRHGHCTVQPLVRETAAYCSRYITAKVLGDEAKTAYAVTDEDGVINYRVPEFSCMSLKPGIGQKWLDSYSGDIFPFDKVIADGTQRSVPKFYDRKFKAAGGDFDAVAYKRDLAARRAFADNTDARLAVREEVQKARLANLKRDL